MRGTWKQAMLLASPNRRVIEHLLSIEKEYLLLFFNDETYTLIYVSYESTSYFAEPRTRVLHNCQTPGELEAFLGEHDWIDTLWTNEPWFKNLNVTPPD